MPEEKSRRPIEPGTLDIVEDHTGATASDPASRPSLRVYFACANQYIRVYRDPAVTSYIARCPKCGDTKRFMVAPGGSDQRFFSLSCR